MSPFCLYSVYFRPSYPLLEVPKFAMEKAVITAKQKLGEVGQLHVQKGGQSHVPLDTSCIFQSAVSSVSLG